jgi:hypothetical protein
MTIGMIVNTNMLISAVLFPMIPQQSLVGAGIGPFRSEQACGAKYLRRKTAEPRSCSVGSGQGSMAIVANEITSCRSR